MKRRLTEGQKKIVAARCDWKCTACHATLSAAYHIDHTIPLWAGGVDSVENATSLCGSCHARKTQREAIERAERKRRLRERSLDARARPPVECSGCGVVFSPYFWHRCGEGKR